MSFNIVTDELKTVAVDQVEPVITLGALNVQVMGGSHTWLYNKLLKLFSTRVKTVVETEMQSALSKSVGVLHAKMGEVTKSFGL